MPPTASTTASPTCLRGLGADLLDLLAAGIEALLRGLARGAGEPAAGLAEQLFLALGARQQSGEPARRAAKPPTTAATG